MDYVIDWKSKSAPWNHLGMEIAHTLKRIASHGIPIDKDGRAPLNMELQCKICASWFGNRGALASHQSSVHRGKVAADLALLKESGKRFS